MMQQLATALLDLSRLARNLSVTASRFAKLVYQVALRMLYRFRIARRIVLIKPKIRHAAANVCALPRAYNWSL
jgi:hypothetical protein